MSETEHVIARASSVTSPTSNTKGKEVIIPLPNTIPIIFIPGIMGSNIRSKQDKVPVWRLGNSLGIAATLGKQAVKSPEKLETELNPLTTEVDTEGDIYYDDKLSMLACTKLEDLKTRGWGSVHWDSYGDILTYLEFNLNQAFSIEEKIQSHFIRVSHLNYKVLSRISAVKEWKSLLDPNETQYWGNTSPLEAITQADIEHLKHFHFPVYALGYNWLQSNEDNAQVLAKKLDDIKKSYCDHFHKFIVVTHSMGGLLTRRLVQLKEADIAGVMHGVMPAEGASLAYRRIVKGCFESVNFNGNPVKYLTGNAKGKLSSYVMGPHTEHTTAVIANSPGSLELLPTPRYNAGKPWLFLTGKDSAGQTQRVALPQSDPYKEVYKSDKVWWEMVKEDLIDPANIVVRKKNQTLKDVYFDKINDVQKFHQNIANHYHPCTYVYHGHDPAQKSFATLTWTLNQPLNGLNPRQLQFLPPASEKKRQIEHDKTEKIIAQAKPKMDLHPVSLTQPDPVLENDGVRHIALNNGEVGQFSISDQDSFGDGTVPHVSGSAPKDKKGVKQVFQMKGFDHQGSYNDEHVRRAVLYSIVKIIKDNHIEPKYPT